MKSSIMNANENLHNANNEHANLVASQDRPYRPWWSVLGRWLFVLSLGYLAALVMLMFMENFLVYRPTSASQEWIPPPVQAIEDVELTSANGVRLHAWWYPHADSQSALLYCHGNAGNLSYRGNSVVKLHDRLQLSVLIFDYPGYGKSTGKPSETGCYAAADAAYIWLTETKKIAPEKIVLLGGSMGGGVALDLASRKPCQALVLIKTFTTMPEVAQCHYPWLPVRWLMRNRYDNLGKIGRCRQPVFIAHGTMDSLVPYSHGERLFAAANQPKFFLSMDHIDHNDPLPPEFFQSLKQFLVSQ